MAIKIFPIILLTILSVLILSSGDEATNHIYDNQVIVHQLSDPEGLNPITTTDISATTIKRNIFQSLMEYDFATLKPVPLLAVGLPKVTINRKSMELTYEIRPEAIWDNGTPITVDDVILSLKILKVPAVNNEHAKPYVEFITDIRPDAANPRKFTFVCNEVYMLATDVTGSITVIPEYIYDADKVLRAYSFADLKKSDIANNPDIIDFADEFNSESYNRDTDKIIGSGAYKYVYWETNKQITLERKANWWGDKVAETEKNVHFNAFPQKLIFRTINDFTTSIAALKNGKIDVAFITPTKEYQDLDKSKEFVANYYKSEPMMLSYQYIGLNQRDPLLADVKVRQALAHLTNVDQIIEKLLYGKAKRIVGDIYHQYPDDYNYSLPLKNYDVQLARKLLAEAGWTDKDKNGILEKKINGHYQDFTLTYNYNHGNPIRETVGLMLQQSFKKVGIKLEIKSLEWSIYLDDLKNGSLQIFYGGWVSDPSPHDPSQIWGTNQIKTGSNYVGFGNAQSDALIAKIRRELDPKKRSELYKKWQKMTYDDGSYIFLYQQAFRNVIHKRFENIQESSYYPGYHLGSFKVKKDYRK